MSENDDVTENQQPQPDPPSEPSEPTPGWRDRVFGLRSMIAVGLAGVILGGGGAATTTALVVDGDRSDHHERVDRPGDGGGFGPGGDAPRSS